MQEFKNLRINSNIVSGDGSIRYLSTFIKENNFKSPAILIDKNLYESSEYISTELENLTPDPHIIIYSYKFEPTYQLLDQMVSDLNENNLKNKLNKL